MMDSELPMIVWLRGDEELCADFVLEADAVMEQLGIKRSRLTQIAGRELRVGRIRRGRYISPVFRQADVDAYKIWTRATASQLKSSSLVQEATAGLVQESERLATSLRDVPRQLAAQIHADLARVSLSVAHTVQDSAAGLREELRAQQEVTLGSEQRLRSLLDKQRTMLHELTTALQQQALQIQTLTRSVGELSALSRLQRQDLQTQAAEQDSRDLGLRQSLNAVQERLGQLEQKQKARRHTSRHYAMARRLRKIAARPSEPKPLAKPPRARAYATAQGSKSRSFSKRIKAAIESSIDNELVSNNTASEACLSGAVSRP